MSTFFKITSTLSGLMLVFALALGHFPESLGVATGTHLIVGLCSILLAVSVHCLIFGIFTGSGKDTRELCQDLRLNAEFAAQTKAFRKDVFPPALYSILLLVMTAVLGGARQMGPTWLQWIHPIWGWFAVLYNLKAFWLESKAVSSNAKILATVNEVASQAISKQPDDAKQIPEIAGFVDAAIAQLEWGTHVFALGKFLCFLGYNVWLPYIYLRFVVGYFTLGLLPFFCLSLALLAGGYYLRFRYEEYRPGGRLVKSESPS